MVPVPFFRPLDQLGAARGVQPQRPGVHRSALADRGTKIIILVPVGNAAAESILLAWQTVQYMVISMP